MSPCPGPLPLPLPLPLSLFLQCDEIAFQNNRKPTSDSSVGSLQVSSQPSNPIQMSRKTSLFSSSSIKPEVQIPKLAAFEDPPVEPFDIEGHSVHLVMLGKLCEAGIVCKELKLPSPPPSSSGGSLEVIQQINHCLWKDLAGLIRDELGEIRARLDGLVPPQRFQFTREKLDAGRLPVDPLVLLGLARQHRGEEGFFLVTEMGEDLAHLAMEIPASTPKFLGKHVRVAAAPKLQQQLALLWISSEPLLADQLEVDASTKRFVVKVGYDLLLPVERHPFTKVLLKRPTNLTQIGGRVSTPVFESEPGTFSAPLAPLAPLAPTVSDHGPEVDDEDENFEEEDGRYAQVDCRDDEDEILTTSSSRGRQGGSGRSGCKEGHGGEDDEDDEGDEGEREISLETLALNRVLGERERLTLQPVTESRRILRQRADLDSHVVLQKLGPPSRFLGLVLAPPQGKPVRIPKRTKTLWKGLQLSSFPHRFLPGGCKGRITSERRFSILIFVLLLLLLLLQGLRPGQAGRPGECLRPTSQGRIPEADPLGCQPDPRLVSVV